MQKGIVVKGITQIGITRKGIINNANRHNAERHTRKGITQIGVTQKGITQLGVTQKGITRKGMTQIGITQIGITRKGITQIDITQREGGVGRGMGWGRREGLVIAAEKKTKLAPTETRSADFIAQFEHGCKSCRFCFTADSVLIFKRGNSASERRENDGSSVRPRKSAF